MRTEQQAPLLFKGPTLICNAFRTMLSDFDAPGEGTPAGSVIVLFRDVSIDWEEIGGLALTEPIVLITSGAQAELMNAGRIGIRAFVGFEDHPDVLRAAIQAAARGEAYCSPTILPNLLNTLREGSQRSSPTPEVPQQELLSEREREIAALVATGRSNEQVAERLFISTTTVKFHLGNIYRKLRISRRGQLYSSLPLRISTGCSAKPVRGGEL